MTNYNPLSGELVVCGDKQNTADQLIEQFQPKMLTLKGVETLRISNESKCIETLWIESANSLEAFKDICNLTSVKSLLLVNIAIIDMKMVTEFLPRLEEMWIDSAVVSSLASFGELSYLSKLTLESVHADGKERIPDMPRLKSLSLHKTPYELLDTGSSCVAVNWLSFFDVDLSRDQLISSGTNLLSYSALDCTRNSTLRYISHPLIEHLSFKYCDYLNLEHLDLPSVETLDLFGVSDFDVTLLSGCPNLQELDLSNTYFTNQEYLSVLEKLNSIYLVQGQLSSDELHELQAICPGTDIYVRSHSGLLPGL